MPREYEFYQKTATRAAIAAQVAGDGIHARRITRESDSGRMWFGNQPVGGRSIEAISVSATGASTLGLKGWCNEHLAKVTAGAGAGAYTAVIIAPLLAEDLAGDDTMVPVEGDRIAIVVAVAASANPVIEIRDATGSGTLLATITGTGTAFEQLVQLHFTGGAWVVTSDGAFVPAARVTGTGTLATTAGKTLTFSNTITIAGTDGITLNVGAGGTLGSMAFQAASAVAITGGTVAGLTGFGIRSSGAAFDLTLATAEVLTAGRTLSFVLGDAARTLTLSGDVSLSGITTTGKGTIGTTLGKTFLFLNTLTIAGTDGSTLNVGAGGTLNALATLTPGTGVATALALNVGSAGAFLTFNGALGTPSSGTLTNCTGLPKADVLEASLFAADAGVNDDYAATLSPAITAYVTGCHYRFKANTANTGPATINFNGLGAKTIVKAAGGITTALADNDIRAGQWVDLVYDGTNMQMQSTLGNASSVDLTAPGPIGGTTPGTGAFTTLSATTVSVKADVLEGPLFAADAGANDSYAATLSPAITAYVTGAHYRFKANTANTGAATINFNGLGAKTIVKVAGGITTALADNDIRAGQWVDVVYDGTNMQMQSTLGNAFAPINAPSFTGGITVASGFYESTSGSRIGYSGSQNYLHGINYGRTTAGSGPYWVLDATSLAATKFVIGGDVNGANTRTTQIKTASAIADAVATNVLTVTVTNAKNMGSLRVRLCGALGAGGAIGAGEATGTIEYIFAITRTAGLATVVTASTAYGSATSSVAGGATITITAAASGISGANSATQTFTIQATISRGSGSSTNHTCVVEAELLVNDSGGTISLS